MTARNGMITTNIALAMFVVLSIAPITSILDRSTIIFADAATCNISLKASAGCILQGDGYLPLGSNCYLNPSVEIGLPAGFSISSPSTDRTTASYCQPLNAGDYRLFNFTFENEADAAAAQFVVTVVAFGPNVARGAEATIRLIMNTTDQERISLGTLIAGHNANIQPELIDSANQGDIGTLRTGVDFSYPNNGKGLCYNKMSYQVWDVRNFKPNPLGVEINDPSGEMKIYAVYGDKCNSFGAAVTKSFGSHGLGALHTASFSPLYKGTLTTAHWRDCAIECAHTANCVSYSFASSGSSCALYGGAGVPIAPVASIPSLPSSGDWTTFGIKTNWRGYRWTEPANDQSGAQLVKSSAPHRYAHSGMSSFSTKFVTFNSSETPFAVLPVQNLVSFAIGAAQTVFNDSSVLGLTAAVYPGGVIQQCGHNNATGGDAFLEAQTHEINDCRKVLNCPTVMHQGAVTGNLLISAPPVPVCAGESTHMQSLYIHHDGSSIHHTRYYYYTTASTGSSTVSFSGRSSLSAETDFTPEDTTVLNTLVELHSLASAAWIETQPEMVTVGETTTAAPTSNTQQKLIRYNIGRPYSTNSPGWRWTDSDGAERSVPLLCEVNSLLGYNVHANATYATATDAYNCDTYNSLHDISSACDASSTCMGFTMMVTNVTNATGQYQESPGCLVKTATVSATSHPNSTFYAKMPSTLECQFPITEASKVAVRITNAMPTATYTILAGSTTVGTCSPATGMPTTAQTNNAEASCNTWVECYVGAISSAETILTVRMSATGPYRRQCPLYLFSARVDFDVHSLQVSPAASCGTQLNYLTASGLATGSSSCVAGDAPPSSIQCTSRNDFGIQVPTSYCAATDENGIWLNVDATITSRWNLITVLDFSSVSATSAKGAAVSVVAKLNTGTVYHLGYVSRSPSGETFYVPRGRAAQKSVSLCSPATDQDGKDLGNAQVFPIKKSLASSVVSIHVRGPNVRLNSAWVLSCGVYPVPRQEADKVFHAMLPRVLSGSPAYAIASAASFADCGNRCGAASSVCRSFSYENGICHLKSGLGAIRSVANETAEVDYATGVATPVLMSETVNPTSTTNTVGELLTGLGTKTGVLFFDPKPGYSPRAVTVLGSALQHFETFLFQTGFQAPSFAAISAVGGGAVCGDYFTGFGHGAGLTDGCSTSSIGACGVPTSNVLWSGPIRVQPMFSNASKFSLGLNTTVDEPVPSSASMCDLPLLGLITVNSPAKLASSGAEHYHASIGTTDPATSTTIASMVTNLAEQGHYVEVGENVTFDGEYPGQLLAYKTGINEDTTMTPLTLSSDESAFCRIANRIQYNIQPAIDTSATGKYNCDVYTTMQAAVAACNNDRSCLGFTADTVLGAVKCLIRSNLTLTQSTVGIALFTKTVTRECTFRLSRPGGVKIRLSQVALPFLTKIKLNGKMVKQCGSTERFIAPKSRNAELKNVEAFTTASCSQYWLCLDQAVAQSGTLTISFDAEAINGALCDHYGAAIVEYTPSTMASALSGTYSALTQKKIIRAVNSFPLKWTIRGQNITTTSLFVEQDRYGCVGQCEVVEAMRMTVNTASSTAIAARCGGSVGFSDNTRGESDNCGLYYHCGELVINAFGAVPRAVSTDGTSVVLQLDTDAPSYHTTTNCDGVFRAALYTDGLLYSAEASTGLTRTRYAVMYSHLIHDASHLVIDSGNASSWIIEQYGGNETFYSSLGRTSFFYQTFPIYENFAQDESARFLVFDVESEPSDRVVPENGTAACIVDDHTDDSTDPGCSMVVAGNWITVQVSQTAFSLGTQRITIQGANFTRVCGGDSLFFGFHGAAGQCETYYKCYDGPVIQGERIRISFTSEVFSGENSGCTPMALALVHSEVKQAASTTVVCEGETPFTCIPESRCLPLVELCDKITHCVDNSDEAPCNNWNYVMTGAEPDCAPLLSANASELGVAVMTPEACQRLAIGHGANSLVVSDDLCRVYNCLAFSEPQLIFATEVTATTASPVATDATSASAGSLALSSTGSSATGVPSGNTTTARRRQVSSAGSSSQQLYILTNDPSTFRYCTDALHCGGNGLVSSTIPPCQCTCDVQYVGSSCAALRDISLVDQLVAVFGPAAVIDQTLMDQLITFVSLELSLGAVATVTSVEAVAATNGDSTTTGTTTAATVASTASPSNATAAPTTGSRRRQSEGQEQAVKISITSTKTSSEAEINNLLTPAIHSKLLARLKPLGVLYLSATSVVGSSSEVNCRFKNFTAPVGEPEKCFGYANINKTKSVVLSVPGISMTSANQWIRVILEEKPTLFNNGGKNVTLTCNAEDFTQSADPLRSGSCSYLSRCVKAGSSLVADLVHVEVSPDINPSGAECEGFVLDLSVTVRGEVDLPAESRASVATAQVAFTGGLLYTSFVLFALGGICLILLLLWFKVRHDFEFFKYTGPLLAGGMFFFIFFAICLYAAWAGSGTVEFTHYFVIEEYRDLKCGDSKYSFIPHRLSYVPADSHCHQVATIGNPEGIAYMSAGVSTSTTDAIVRIGGSMESCDLAEYVPFPVQNCTREGVFFSSKSELETHFISGLSLPRDIKDARVAAIEQFNPPLNLSSVSTVAGLAIGTKMRDRVDYRTFFVSGQQVSRLSPFLSPRTGLGFPDHFIIFERSEVPERLLSENSTDPRIIRFKGTINTERTLFSPPAQHTIDEPPSIPISPTTQLPYYVGVGSFFNAYQTALARTGSSASEDAMIYQGSYDNSTEFDLGKLADFTLTFWVNADTTTRGVAFAITDNWLTTEHASPIIDRLMEVIENSAVTTPWFSEPWTIYSSVYLNGESKSLYFVFTTYRGEVIQLQWDTAYIGADRLFDGGWHHVGLTFDRELSRYEAQLYVDGETHFTEEGWRKCLPNEIPRIQDRVRGSSTRIFNRRQEVVKEGFILALGYLNAGLYDFMVHPTLLPQEKIVNYGAPSMALYSKLAETESFVLGILMIILTFGCLALSGYQVYNHFFGVDDDLEEDVEDPDAAVRDPKATHAAAAGSNVQTVQFWQFITPISLVGQSMGMYIAGWEWPVDFTAAFGTLWAALSLDWMDVFPDVPLLVPAVIQFFLATSVLFAILYLAIRDEVSYEKNVQNYRESKKERPKNIRLVDDDRPKPSYRWVVWRGNEVSEDLTDEQREVVMAHLTDLLTSRHKRDANMRLHTKSLISIPELGTGVLLYERVKGKVHITFRAEEERDENTGECILRVYCLEALSDNRECPMHELRLIPMETSLPCIHEDNALYRSMNCPKVGQFYKCPDESCDFAVCEQCYFHTGGASAMSGAMSGALAKMHEIRQLGVAGTVGTAVVLLAAIVYLPVVKNAMMIIFCHPTYQCEFGSCSGTNTTLIIANLMSYIIVFGVGVGLIIIELILLRRRHKVLIPVIPMQPIHRKYNCHLLPQNIPRREDWEGFLKFDKSMLVSLYEPFEFQYFWVSPAQLVYRAAIISALVIAEPNSVAQLSSICAVEVVYAFLIMSLSPYKNPWVEALSRLGSFHNLIQLGMTGLHRVELRQNPDSEGYGPQMIWCSALYIALVVVMVIAVIVVPAVQRYLEQRQRLARGVRGEDENDDDAEMGSP